MFGQAKFQSGKTSYICIYKYLPFFFSCWNYLIQKIQENGISWKQRYIEFMVNSWDSVRISENRLTIYFIGKTILSFFFIPDYLLLLCLLWHCKSCYFCTVEASVMYGHAASSVPSICENEVNQGRFFSECWHSLVIIILLRLHNYSFVHVSWTVALAVAIIAKWLTWKLMTWISWEKCLWREIWHHIHYNTGNSSLQNWLLFRDYGHWSVVWVLFGRHAPTFQGYLLPPSSW